MSLSAYRNTLKQCPMSLSYVRRMNLIMQLTATVDTAHIRWHIVEILKVIQIQTWIQCEQDHLILIVLGLSTNFDSDLLIVNLSTVVKMRD
eukprot:2781822-Rhodomonas_salina.1